MDKLELFFCFLAYSLYVYIPTKQSMHMFQQNRYHLVRYTHWLHMACKDSWKQMLISFLCFATCYGLFLVDFQHLPNILLLLLVFIFAYIAYKVEEDKTYRKPLQYTSRIKRLLVGFYCGYILFFTILAIVASTHVWIFITPFLYFFPYLFLYCIGAIMQPMEMMIRNHYANEAKLILRQHQDLLIIGITGSYGKTSVKTILYELLSDSYYTLMTPHSYNNQMGITLTVRQQLQRLHEIFLCEMGADHIHEISDLMSFVQPQYGVVTAVGPQHLQTFHSIEHILHEKMQMIEKLPCDGIGFLNKDNAYIRSCNIQNTCQIIWFSMHCASDYQACDILYSPQGSTFSIVYKGKKYPFHTKLLGEHNVLNITCAIAIAHTLHVSWLFLQQMVTRLPFVKHRLEIRYTPLYTILDDAYNANPQGAGYALDVLQQMPGRRFVVTPGFIDLGEQQEEEQFRFGQKIAECADVVILVGRKQCVSIVKGLDAVGYPSQHVHIADSIQEGFALLKKIATPQDVVLLENDLPDAFHH